MEHLRNETRYKMYERCIWFYASYESCVLYWGGLRRMDGQQITNQINHKFFKYDIFGHKLLSSKKIHKYFSFKFWMFSYIFIKRSSFQGDKYSWKMATNSQLSQVDKISLSSNLLILKFCYCSFCILPLRQNSGGRGQNPY